MGRFISTIAACCLSVPLLAVKAFGQVPPVAPQVLGNEYRLCSNTFLQNARSATPMRYETFWYVLPSGRVVSAHAQKPRAPGNWVQAQAISCYYGWLNTVWVRSN